MVPELSVRDFEISLAFYKDMLGFSVRHRRSAPDFAYLECETVQIMIEQLTDDSWITGDMTTPLGRGVNFQIELSSIAPIHDRLKAADYPLFEEMAEEWYETGEMMSGQREFLAQDPDGYLLRFTESLGERPKD